MYLAPTVSAWFLTSTATTGGKSEISNTNPKFPRVAFHVLIVYALVNGMAKKVVDVVRVPIETRLIEEIVEPPPPPPPPPVDRHRAEIGYIERQ